ncbi:MAG: DUF58 domain-containing protein [Planctomycetes bacterium]|nr:DUF58 domain-containing protein [Planctomycetota bacterium]
MPTSPPTRFLEVDILRSIANIELVARMLVEGMYASRHRSPYYGFSVEFVDHREYAPGDELSKIDWRALARTEKYFVKRFEMESNMNVICLLDISGSMGYKSKNARRLTKLEYGSFLAASLCFLVYKQQDASGLVTFDQTIRDFLPARQGQRHLYSILSKLDVLNAEGDTEVGDVLKTIAMRLKRRGIIVLISDCYGETDAVVDGIRHLATRGHDVIVFQLMDHDEVTFPFQSLVSFRDLESNTQLIGDPLRQRRIYLNRFDQFRTEIREGCAAAGADYRFVDTSEPIELVLRDYLLYRRQMAS